MKNFVGAAASAERSTRGHHYRATGPCAEAEIAGDPDNTTTRVPRVTLL
jgi:hypothetical protein